MLLRLLSVVVAITAAAVVVAAVGFAVLLAT